MSKHTPGHCWGCRWFNALSPERDEHMGFCNLCRAEVDGSNQKCAAPDLLEAAKKFVEMWDAQPDVGENPQWVLEAKEAIKKAEGSNESK